MQVSWSAVRRLSWLRVVVPPRWAPAAAVVALTLSAQVGEATSPPEFVLDWGQLGTGSGDFDEPGGIAVDSSGDVFIVDRNNHRVQKFGADGSLIGSWGTFGSGNGEFDSPREVAIDSNGDVYVTDGNNNRVQKFSGFGAYLAQWGTTGTGNGQFIAPRGIAIDSNDNVYVTEDGLASKRVQKFTSAGSYITQWGSFGTGNGQFFSPRGIAAGNGHVYVTDALNNNVHKFTEAGSFVTKWGSGGSGSSQFSFPLGVCWAPCGVYVVDSQNHRVQVFDESGSFQFEFGTHCELSSGTDCVDPDGGGPLGLGDGQFHNPHGVCLDASENVYITDRENHRAVKFQASPSSSVGDVFEEIGSVVRAYPNPAGAGSTVRVELRLGSRESAAAGSGLRVDARVYDVAGRLVRSLYRGEFMTGTSMLEWDGLTEARRPAPGGVYFIRVGLEDGREFRVRVVVTR